MSCFGNVSKFFGEIATCNQTVKVDKYIFFVIDDSIIDESCGTPNQDILDFIHRIKNFGAKSFDFESGFDGKSILGLLKRKINDSFLHDIFSLLSTMKTVAENDSKELADLIYIHNLEKYQIYYETDDNLDFLSYHNKDYSKYCYEVQEMSLEELLELDSTKLSFTLKSEYLERYTQEELELLSSPALSELITLIETNRGVGVYIVGTGSGGAILKQDKIDAILNLE